MNLNYIVYPGNKTKYIDYICGCLTKKHFDKKFIEPFGGSGTISLYCSNFIKDIYLNEINNNIYKIHYSFKHGTWEQLNTVINEIWNFGNPKQIKEDYYIARNTLNKKYNDDSIKTGFYNWAISTFAINSMIRFGPNGFNQGWGHRGIEKNSKTMNEGKFNKINNAYKNINLFSEDFEIFINRFDDGILFVDPPYLEMNSGIYSFSLEQYNTFINIIKNWKDDVLYTDIYSDKKIKLLGSNWNYMHLRKKMGTANPGKEKENKKLKTESLYFNFKLNNITLW